MKKTINISCIVTLSSLLILSACVPTKIEDKKVINADSLKTVEKQQIIDTKPDEKNEFENNILAKSNDNQSKNETKNNKQSKTVTTIKQTNNIVIPNPKPTQSVVNPQPAKPVVKPNQPSKPIVEPNPDNEPLKIQGEVFVPRSKYEKVFFYRN